MWQERPPRPRTPTTSPGGREHASPVHALRGALRLGPPRQHGPLTLWPLLCARSARPPLARRAPPCLLLAEALYAGQAEVSELRPRPIVDRLRVVNRARWPLLILFGEMLRGARQDRVATASFLVPARREAEIGVACVEAGRWGSGRAGPGAEPERLARSESLLAQALRCRLEQGLRVARLACGGFAADQTDLWQAVAARLAREGVMAPTGTAAALRTRHAAWLAGARRAFPPQADQRGFVAAIGSAVAGLEVLGGVQELAAALPALVEAYALDAGAARSEAEEPPRRAPRPDVLLAAAGGPARFEAPEPFLSALLQTEVRAAPSGAAGEDWRLLSPRVRGCALTLGEAVMHLSAFPALLEGAP